MSDHDPFGWDDPDAHDPGIHDAGIHDPGAGHGDTGWPAHDPPGYEHALGDLPWPEPSGTVPPADLSDLDELGDLSDTGAPADAPGFEDGFADGVPDLVGEAAAPHPGGLLDTWPVGADPDHVADEHGPVGLFPPALHVPLPEPVDGFPWADPGLLGDAAIGAAADAAPDPAGWVADPAGLAAYAGVDLPPDADPWAVLADSDDPATSALARWWAPDPPVGG